MKKWDILIAKKDISYHTTANNKIAPIALKKGQIIDVVTVHRNNTVSVVCNPNREHPGIDGIYTVTREYLDSITTGELYHFGDNIEVLRRKNKIANLLQE